MLIRKGLHHNIGLKGCGCVVMDVNLSIPTRIFTRTQVFCFLCNDCIIDDCVSAFPILNKNFEVKVLNYFS